MFRLAHADASIVFSLISTWTALHYCCTREENIPKLVSIAMVIVNARYLIFVMHYKKWVDSIEDS